MSVPVVGPLSVTPLYTAAGDILVWWDGAEWQQITVSIGGPPSGGGGVISSPGGGAIDSPGGGAVDTPAGGVAGLRAQVAELEARIAALEGGK